MNAVLVILTIVSAVAAAVFGLTAWRAMAEDRRRAAARVAALAAAIGGSNDGTRTPVPVAMSSMFAMTPEAAIGGRRLITTGVVTAMVVALIVAVAMSTRNRGTEPATILPAASASPLELMSMRHTREGNTLRVTGLVRNPDTGTPVGGVAAVVFAFDRAGNFVVSGQTPLDFTRLAPGEESPFVVTLGNAGDVGRYRISFRTDAGVLRHVDRRAQTQLALR